MTDDRVYPASKPPAAAGAANPAFPATKAQLYGASRPPYRPQAHRHSQRHRRSCCCRCCCWTIFAVILLILLAAAAAAVVYLLYRPTRPTFSVSSLKISTLNITSSSHIITAIDLNVSTRNPNKKVVFNYDDTNIEISTGDDVIIGKGMFPGFEHEGKKTTVMKGVIGKPDKDILDETEAKKLKSEMKGTKGLGLKIVMDTKVSVKMGALKIPKTGIRVTCDGIRANAPNGKKATMGSIEGAKCKVDLRFKIWKFRFG